MSVPTLQQLIEEKDAKTVVAKIIIGGTELPKWTNCSYQFEIGQVPTATITVPGLGNLPLSVQEEAAVEIWFGYKVGSTVLTRLVFGGAIVDSVGNNGADITITCVMDGPRKLSYSYNRRIAFDFDNVTAEEAVTSLLGLAGVVSFAVNLDPWLIGTVVPYTAALGNQIQFSSYGDAINKVAEVDGSPWYAMPTGQVRVEKRDPIPSPTARRTYFTSILTGPVETQPVGITNPLARPRITDISKNKNRRDVANFIEVDGAVVVTLGPNGEQNSDQIKETVDGLSGQFPNGAYWIPTPPLFQDFNFSNELIDTNAKAFEVCERYFDLKNRLFEDLPITVPGDPDVFLGETVAVKDPIYSGTGSLYFVKGYSTTIDQSSCTTQLNLTGGPESGTTGFASPFAEFTWTYDPLIIPGGGLNPIILGPNKRKAAKLCEDKPADSTPPDNTDNPDQGTDSAMVYIGLDGSSSQDFDGFIVSWVWTWNDSDNVPHTLSGPRQTIVMEPSGSVNMTLTVTDNSGRTDSITKNINTSVSLSNPPTFDPNMDDTPDGGGEGAGPCTEQPEFPNPYCFGDDCNENPGECQGLELGYFVAAKSVAMGSVDNRTWHDLTKVAAGVSGDFISVDAAVNNQAQKSCAIFGTDQGEIVKSIDICATGDLVFTVPGGPRIESVHFDTQQMGSPTGELPPTEDPPVANSGNIPVYTFASPGTMTIVQAYQQCRAVGFSHDTAIVAVAIMVRESGLYSKAMNTAGNTPPSTDRGICQWNDFYHPDITDACAYNTQCAITAMFRKSSGGSDFSPWNVHGPGTYLQGTNLSAVQQAVSGISDTTITPQNPTIQVSPAGLKVWVGTSDGRIYVSEDSGETWELWIDFHDGFPILQIGTPPRYGAQTNSLWAFGGGDIDSLVRIDPAIDRNFVPLFIGGDLREEIVASGFGRRFESDDPKGYGFFGPLLRPDGTIMTEFSIGVEIDGNETQIPSLVPTLTEAEIIELLNLDPDDLPSPTIIAKATDFAIERLANDLPVFAKANEQDLEIYPDLVRQFGTSPPVISSNNETASILVFIGGDMTDKVWTNPDPLGSPDGWTPCDVGASTYNTVVGGYGGEFVIAGSAIEKTDDNENFASLGSPPSTVNHMIWRGLPGMYAMALDDGLYTTIDFGATMGPLRPNAGFSTTWPVGAIGYQVAVSYGARTCPTIPEDDGNDCVNIALFGFSGLFDESFDAYTKIYRNLKGIDTWLDIGDVGAGEDVYPTQPVPANDGETLYFLDSDQNTDRLWVSEDAGLSWVVKSEPNDQIQMISVDADDRLWAASEIANVGTLYRSDDKGDSFTAKLVPGGNVQMVQTFPGHHPTNANKVAFGYSDLVTNEHSVSVSTDGGDNWTTTVVETGAAPGFAKCAWLPSGRIVCCYLNFPNVIRMVYSDDEGVTWSSPVTIHTTADDTSQGFLLVTYQEFLFILQRAYSDCNNVMLRSDGGITWEEINLPYGACGVDIFSRYILRKSDGTLFVNVLYSDTGFGYLAGLWSLPNASTATSDDWVQESSYPDNANLAAFAVATVCPPVGGMFIVVNNDMFSFDGTSVAYTITDDPNQENGNYSYCLKSFNGNLFWLSRNVSDEGILFRSEDNGLTSIPGGSLAPGYITHFDIATDGTIYAIVSSVSDAIYKSTDGGDSWSLVLGSLENNTYRGAIACNPADVNRIAFIELSGGLSASLRVSTNAGASFSSLALVAPFTGLDTFFGFQPRWLPSGRLVWVFFTDATTNLLVQWSDDDGASVTGSYEIWDTSNFSQFDGMWMDSNGVLYISALNYSHETHIFRSPDGATWTDMGAVGGTIGNTRLQGAAFSNGAMYLLFSGVNSGPPEPELWKIDSPGTTWSPELILDNSSPAPFGTGATSVNNQDAFVAVVN